MGAYGPSADFALDRALELNLRDQPSARALHVLGAQDAALGPTGESSALRVRHPRQCAILRDGSFEFHCAVESPGRAQAIRSDLNDIRLPRMIRCDATH